MTGGFHEPVPADAAYDNENAIRYTSFPFGPLSAFVHGKAELAQMGRSGSRVPARPPNVVGMRCSDNVLEAARVSGATRVTRSLARPPVRFVFPEPGGVAALAVASALGGGMLEGDDYRYRITVKPEARLLFAPQSNTRVFPCPAGTVTRQSIEGTIHGNGLLVCGGDPVVPYLSSRFAQSQRWILHPGARLVLFDWMIAGRLARDERFAFTDYENTVRIETPEGCPLLVDAQRLEAASPDGTSRAPRGVGGFASVLAIHVVGPGWEELHAPLEAWLRTSGSTGPSARPRWMDDGRLCGIGIRDGLGFSLRALGADRTALEPLADTLFTALASARWLGFDFWKRKY